jgi:uncharacterized membrane protein YkvA (DUF1232 family)
MSDKAQSFERHYSDTSFRNKLARYARTAGRHVVEKALYLHYAARSPNTPRWARTAIYGALGYFVMPIDAIPDFTPILGFSDDMSIMLAALAATAVYITDDVKLQARTTLTGWFGPDDDRV